MHYPDLSSLLPTLKTAKGPLALIVAEDGALIDETVAHHVARGFRRVIVLTPRGLDWQAGAGAVDHVAHDTGAPTAAIDAVNAISRAVPPGTWIYYGFNAEFLFYPYCETRSVGELLAFHEGERRDAMLAYVVDLYAGDVAHSDNAVSIGDAWLDGSGYFALERANGDGTAAKDRQLDLYGGLRWRFEEHVPYERRRIDRVALFRATPGVGLRDDFTFSEEEYNTYACPWHHNLSAAVCSFRTAKALRTNPGSRAVIDSFRWQNSLPFEWKSRQLLDLGLMEPGQWV